ncbi:MAG: hypothetical protein KAQ94_08735 [Arcobacteraceae bacterium]|nr:hypothetical protein [Arcobacteraceae bacterium]
MENDTTENKEQSNILLYSLAGLLVVITGLVVYVYIGFDMVKKGDLEDKYIKTEEVTFTSLPSYIQDEYIKKYTFTSKINILNEEIKQLKKKNEVSTHTNENENEVESIVKIAKEVEPEVEAIIEIAKEVDIVVDKTKYKSYMCTDMANGTIYPSTNCVKLLNEFLDTNKDAKIFEVIGMVDTKEFKILNKLRQNNDTPEVDRISNFAQLGLSRQRVIEATWGIKGYLGTQTNIKVVNYTIVSKKKYKGFIVRAYK